MHRAIARLKVEIIVLFGYSIGLLILAGFFMDGRIYARDNPFWQLKNIIEATLPDIYIRITLGLLLLLILGLSVRKAYTIGGPAAIIAVAMGFLAGLATPSDLIVGPAMLLLATISAFISVQAWRTQKRPQG